MSNQSVFNLHGSAVINIADQWYLNEENVFIGSSDAHKVLESKVISSLAKRYALLEETYTSENAIRLIKKHYGKVTSNLLESCLGYTNSKAITNRPDVIDLRKSGSTLLNKYIFNVNNECVALSESQVEFLKTLSDEEIELIENADDLLETIKGATND